MMTMTCATFLGLSPLSPAKMNNTQKKVCNFTAQAAGRAPGIGSFRPSPKAGNSRPDVGLFRGLAKGVV